MLDWDNQTTKRVYRQAPANDRVQDTSRNNNNDYSAPIDESLHWHSLLSWHT